MTSLASVVICWLLSMIIGISAYHKVKSWPRFLASMSAYKILPSWVPPELGGLLLIFCEVTATFLLLGMQYWGLIMAMALLFLYSLVITANLIWGRTHIDCGCGDEPSPISTFLVGRNLFLLALAYIASKYIYGSPSLNWNTLIFTILSAGLFYGVYMIFEQLMTNRGRHIRLWLGEQS